MKNIVLSICMNYDYTIFERFVGSLLDVTNNTDLVLFISANDINHCVKLQNIYNSLKYVVVDNKNIHIVNYRFILYYYYLINNLNYNYIFICDSRDVLFQKDIFTHHLLEKNYDLYIFNEETNNITVDKCKFNSLYINKSGLNIHNLVENKPVICVGTILGNMKGILNYLKEFHTLLLGLDPINKTYYGTDSGINYAIIYGNLLKSINVYVCKNSDCLVYTMAFPIHLQLIDYNTLLNNNLITYNNNICYCVHQYDRLPDIIKKNISIKYDYTI